MFDANAFFESLKANTLANDAAGLDPVTGYFDAFAEALADAQQADERREHGYP